MDRSSCSPGLEKSSGWLAKSQVWGFMFPLCCGCLCLNSTHTHTPHDNFLKATFFPADSAKSPLKGQDCALGTEESERMRSLLKSHTPPKKKKKKAGKEQQSKAWLICCCCNRVQRGCYSCCCFKLCFENLSSALFLSETIRQVALCQSWGLAEVWDLRIEEQDTGW